MTSKNKKNREAEHQKLSEEIERLKRSNKRLDYIVNSSKFIPYIFAGVFVLSNLIFLEANVLRNREAYFNSPNIYKSDEEFKKDFEKEKKQLGLENITIEFTKDDSIRGGWCKKYGDKYLLKMNPEFWSRRILKHELYHIKEYEVENNLTFRRIANIFFLDNIEEWDATSYSLNE
ncbi:MAG: hypothetical protein Q8L29_01590 [archaeon]|nr:hypothetical protein [archaeon]